MGIFAKTPSVFRLRRLVSFLLFFSFVLVAISGLALYLRPEGSLARWVGWKFVFFSKNNWEGVHTAFVVLFFFCVLLHLVFNFRTLLGYLKRKTAPGNGFSLELIAAVMLIVIVFSASQFRWFPFSWLLAKRTEVKEGKYTVQVFPPYGDADKSSVARIIQQLGMAPEVFFRRISSRGWSVVDLSQSLAEAARKNRVSPEVFYSAIAMASDNKQDQ